MQPNSSYLWRDKSDEGPKKWAFDILSILEFFLGHVTIAEWFALNPQSAWSGDRYPERTEKSKTARFLPLSKDVIGVSAVPVVLRLVNQVQKHDTQVLWTPVVKKKHNQKPFWEGWTTKRIRKTYPLKCKRFCFFLFSFSFYLINYFKKIKII